MCKILFNEEGDFHSGALILVDKPLKWTSFDVVNKIRWCLKSACGKIKVGHAGTLDPLATGLVIVCTGKWTKRIEDYMALGTFRCHRHYLRSPSQRQFRCILTLP